MRDKFWEYIFILVLIILFIFIVVFYIKGINAKESDVLFKLFNNISRPTNMYTDDPPPHTSDYVTVSWILDSASGNVTPENGNTDYDLVPYNPPFSNVTYQDVNIGSLFGLQYGVKGMGSSDDFFETTLASPLVLTPPFTVIVVANALTNAADAKMLVNFIKSDNSQYFAIGMWGFQAYCEMKGTDAVAEEIYLTTATRVDDSTSHIFICGADASDKGYFSIDDLSQTWNDITLGTISADYLQVMGSHRIWTSAWEGTISAVAILNVAPTAWPIIQDQLFPNIKQSQNDQTFIDYYRSSGAYAPMKLESGTFMQASVTNSARQYYNGTAYGYIFEQEHTNVCLQSNDFSTTWDTTGGVSVEVNIAYDMFNRELADRLTDNSGANAEYITQTLTVSAATTYTACVWLKLGSAQCASGNQVTLELDGTASDVTIDATLKQYCVTDASSSGVAIDFNIYPCDKDDTSDTGDVIGWGAQVVAGSNKPIGYIPTTTGTVKQEEEYAQLVHATDYYGIDPNYFSFCGWINLQHTTQDQNYTMISFSDPGGDNWELFGGFNNLTPSMQIYNCADELLSDCDGCSLTAGTWTQLCIFLDNENGKVAWYQDGTFIEEDTDTWSSNATLLTTMTLGAVGAGNYSQLNGLVGNWEFYRSSKGNVRKSEGANLAKAHYARGCAYYGVCP